MYIYIYSPGGRKEKERKEKKREKRKSKEKKRKEEKASNRVVGEGGQKASSRRAVGE